MQTKLETTPPAVQSLKIEDFKWPHGKRCAVAIGWHVDGEAGPVSGDAGNAIHVAALSEGAYGVSTALPRILDLHAALDVPGSFFVPGYVADLHPEIIKAVAAAGHELAHHGYLHENALALTETEEDAVFERGYKTLHNLTGAEIVGWSAPLWGVRQSTLEMLCKKEMLYDSSLMQYDTPYFVKTAAGTLVELPLNPALDDWPLFGLSLSPQGGSSVSAPAETAYNIWKEEFDGARRFGCLFTTTFHPNLTGRPGRLMMLYRLLAYMKSFDDVWWASCAEIAQYVQSTYGEP